MNAQISVKYRGKAFKAHSVIMPVWAGKGSDIKYQDLILGFSLQHVSTDQHREEV